MAKSTEESSASRFRLFLLALMVLQNSSTVLVGRYTRSTVKTEDAFEVQHMLLITEFVKMILSALLEYHTTNGQLLKSIQKHIISHPLDFLRILIPALLYLVQNTLLYVALTNLSAPLFQVIYQGKLLTTALISMILLNRRYKLRQWICLTLLGIGVAVVVLGENSSSSTKEANDNKDNNKNEQSLSLGMICLMTACVCSALAGVYFEKVLKTPKNKSMKVTPPSLWMRNIQLAFFSVCTVLLDAALGISSGGNSGSHESTTATSQEHLFLHGFTFWVWVLVFLQAGGGLLVAAVIKYADNVLKGMATGVAVVFSTLCSMVVFGTALRLQFTVGAGLILISVYFFSNEFNCGNKVKMDERTRDSEAEMKPILPR